MAPWQSSINGNSIYIPANLLVDARQTASGCSTVNFQGITLRLSADLTIYADALTSINGLNVISHDGYQHRVEIVVPGTTTSCGTAKRVSFSPGTTFDSLLHVAIRTPGKVTLDGASALNGTIDARCFASSGTVDLRE